MDFFFVCLGVGMLVICFSIADYIENKGRAIADRKKENDNDADR